MARYISAIGFFTGTTVPLTKCFRQPARASKILPKPAWHPAHRKKQKLNPNYAIGDYVELFALVWLTPISKSLFVKYLDLTNIRFGVSVTLMRNLGKTYNVARASLEELLIDYQDFLRTNKLQEWEKDSRLVIRLRELNKIPNATYETFKRGIENENPEICANVMIGLIRFTGYLLSRQLRTLEIAFINEGGMRERMTAARINKRNKGM